MVNMPWILVCGLLCTISILIGGPMLYILRKDRREEKRKQRGHSQTLFIETNAKKLDWLKSCPLVKNPLFLSNRADILATLATHELLIFTKFHKDKTKNMDCFTC